MEVFLHIVNFTKEARTKKQPAERGGRKVLLALVAKEKVV